MVTEEQINIMRERLTDEVYYALFKREMESCGIG